MYFFPPYVGKSTKHYKHKMPAGIPLLYPVVYANSIHSHSQSEGNENKWLSLIQPRTVNQSGDYERREDEMIEVRHIRDENVS